MNVFILDRSMEKSAQYLDDAHLQEFLDNAFHGSLKPDISDEAKALAKDRICELWNQDHRAKENK